MYWQHDIDWETPAGETIQDFVAALPDTRQWSLTVFGLPLLQLDYGASLWGNVIRVFGAQEDFEPLADVIAFAGLRSEFREVSLSPCVWGNFQTTPAWWTRARILRFENVEIRLPQPIDLLISRLRHLDTESLEAFREVIRRTGHPTAWEMRRELAGALDLFRPNFPEDPPNMAKENTSRLWRKLWEDEIDVHREIILPVLNIVRACVEADISRSKNEKKLRDLGES